MKMDQHCRLVRSRMVWIFLWPRQSRSQRVSMGSGVSTGQWHHLMVSYDENAFDDYELKVYLGWGTFRRFI